MKRLKNLLRLWMATVSLGGFLGGWVLLAHAPKPASSSSVSSDSAVTAPLPTLTPLPPVIIGNGGGQITQPIPSAPIVQSRPFLPVLRTHGS